MATDSIAQNLVDFFLSKDSEEDIFVKFFVPTMNKNSVLVQNPGYK
jgi:hypothetical protein